MPILVELPDGTMREMPSRRREIKSREISANPRPSIFIDEPAPHPDYTFTTAIGGHWWAHPRLR